MFLIAHWKGNRGSFAKLRETTGRSCRQRKDHRRRQKEMEHKAMQRNALLVRKQQLCKEP